MSTITQISRRQERVDNETLDPEVMNRLRSAADQAATWEVIPRPRADASIKKRVQTARQTLSQLEATLARQSLAEVPNDPPLAARRSALLELAAGHRMFRSAISDVSDKRRELARLPRLVLSPRHDEPRIATVARLYLGAVDGTFSALTFQEFIQAIQTHEPLNVDELWGAGTLLKFTLLELILEEAREVLRSRGKDLVTPLLVHIKSLQSITNADWVYLIEPLIVLDEFLRQDPAEIFERMDFETRELYRKRIGIVARRSDCSESQVAQTALQLAREGYEAESGIPRIHLRRGHVGYYIIGNGFSDLATRVGFHPCFAWRARAIVRANGEDFFLSGIQLSTLLFIAAALFPVLPAVSGFMGLACIVLFLLIPATQDAVDLINNAITSFFDPEPLPKLDFSKGIPPSAPPWWPCPRS